MRRPAYDEEQAMLLTPLLEAIGREIIDREEAIRALLKDASQQLYDPDWLARELYVHRDELAGAHMELEELGCSLVGRRPLTFRIRRAGVGPRSFLWQGTDLVAY